MRPTCSLDVRSCRQARCRRAISSSECRAMAYPTRTPGTSASQGAPNARSRIRLHLHHGTGRTRTSGCSNSATSRTSICFRKASNRSERKVACAEAFLLDIVLNKTKEGDIINHPSVYYNDKSPNSEADPDADVVQLYHAEPGRLGGQQRR